MPVFLFNKVPDLIMVGSPDALTLEVYEGDRFLSRLYVGSPPILHTLYTSEELAQQLATRLDPPAMPFAVTGTTVPLRPTPPAPSVDLVAWFLKKAPEPLFSPAQHRS